MTLKLHESINSVKRQRVELACRLDNNVMHAKPDLRVFLKWMIARSGSVITDVIRLMASCD